MPAPLWVVTGRNGGQAGAPARRAAVEAPPGCWFSPSFLVPEFPLEAVGSPLTYVFLHISLKDLFQKANYTTPGFLHLARPPQLRGERGSPLGRRLFSPSWCLSAVIALLAFSWVPSGMSTSSRTTGHPLGESVQCKLGHHTSQSPRERRVTSCSSGTLTGGLVLTCQSWGVPLGQGLCSDTCSFCLPGTCPLSSNHSPIHSLLLPRSSLLTPVPTLHGLGETHSAPGFLGGQGAALQAEPPGPATWPTCLGMKRGPSRTHGSPHQRFSRSRQERSTPSPSRRI